MICSMWQEAISARVDGETPQVAERLLDAHLEHCHDCRSFEAASVAARRTLLVTEATPMPDLSRRVSRLNAMFDRASAVPIVRALLFVVACEIVVIAAWQLITGDGNGNPDSDHLARHLGAFSLAYGVALVVAAVRPARARTVLPVTMVLAGALVASAVVDLAAGSIPLTNETVHLPELISVVLVWLLARPNSRVSRRTRA